METTQIRRGSPKRKGSFASLNDKKPTDPKTTEKYNHSPNATIPREAENRTPESKATTKWRHFRPSNRPSPFAQDFRTYLRKKNGPAIREGRPSRGIGRAKYVGTTHTKQEQQDSAPDQSRRFAGTHTLG